MCFTILQNVETPFQAIKTRSSKSEQIAIFPKGLVHGFGQKLSIFPNFFLRQYRRGNCVLRCSRTKKRRFRLRNKNLKKWNNCHFSKGVSPWFCSKIGHFSMFCFKALQTRKMCFTILTNEETPLQAIKTRSSKRGKIAIFPKGFVHGFGQKLAIFPNFFLRAMQERKMCFTIFQNEKTPFQAIKTRSSKSRKIDIFPKELIHRFGPKMAIFPTFFFQAIQVRKMSFMIFQNEKTPF